MAKRAAKSPIIVHTLTALRRKIASYRKAGKSVALVPTMGALHAGHLALVREAQKRCDRVVVSIFVNPTQFAPTEDFGSYPRTMKTDVAALAAVKADLVWAPSAAVMYPPGFALKLQPEGAALAGLEDRFRPHFFGGVAIVVSKLFTQVTPDVALFGQKDYQQLRVVTQMAKDLDLPLKVVGIPTVREKDGLALSSRNVYLSDLERRHAVVLSRTLKTCAARIKAGEPIAMVMEEGRRFIEQAEFTVDYVEARHALTLAPVVTVKDGPIRLLVAAKIGKTRLIDNLAV
jgi:pantoate--beta-alanine ligase